jgi:23S rRNA (cytidine1920-2'-O)/16S rRNA (cytidine1409-2'-O)-methyltransferase
MRLCDYLIASGLAQDEREARGLAMRGSVLINDQPVTSPLFEVTQQMRVRLRHALSADISKGAAKLRPVAESLGLNCAGRVCLDLGVSTGGFTQVLLERGAARIYAVDVGYGITALEIRNDSRVVLLERTNVRELTSAQVPEPVAVVVGDLSFISWAAVLPSVIPLLADQAVAVLLVKPQFELAARGQGRLLDHGVLRDPAIARGCINELYNVWVGHGLKPEAVVPAAATGAKGNQEYFVRLTAGGEMTDQAAYEAMVSAALSGAWQ